MAIFRPLIVSPGLSWLSAGDERSFASGRKGPDGVGADGVGCLGVPMGAILIPVWAETALRSNPVNPEVARSLPFNVHTPVWPDDNAIGVDLEGSAGARALGKLVRHRLSRAAKEPIRGGLW